MKLIQMKKNNCKISVIGAGKVGSAISYALYRKGFNFLTVIDKNLNKASRLKNIVKAKNFSDDIKKIGSETTFLLITTPDDVIYSVASQISKLKNINFENLIAIQTSGVHSTDSLRPLELKGARVLSFHPIQTLTSKLNKLKIYDSVTNIYFGVETRKENYSIAKTLAGYLNSKVIFVKKEYKPLYHIACVFASNYIITQLNAIELLAKKIKMQKVWKHAFKPLINASVTNALYYTPTEVLTGPIERGDVKTLQIHIENLKNFAPEFLEFYCASGIETLKIALKKKSINENKFSKIKKLFEQNISVGKKL